MTNRFTIIYNSIETILQKSPVGWDNRNRSLPRSEKYYASFRKFTGDFTFVFDGYTLLKSIYESDGVNAVAYLRVEKYNAKTDVYNLESLMKLDFTTYSETANENGNGIKMALVDDDFTQMFFAREEIEIPYDRHETLDDVAITPFPSKNTDFLDGNTFTDADGYRTAKVFGMEVADTGVQSLIDEGTYTQSSGANRVAIPAISTNYINPSFNNVAVRQWNGSFGGDETFTTFYTYDCFFYTTGGATIDIDWLLNYRFYSTLGTEPNNWELHITIYKAKFNTLGEWVSNSELWRFDYNNHVKSGIINENISTTLLANEGLVFTVYNYAINAFTSEGSYFEIKPDSLFTIDFAEKYQPTYTPVLRIHEAATRVIESITGIPNAFYSECFGRTDLGYASDGEWCNITVTNGKLFRNFPIGYKVEDSDDKNIYSQLAFSFWQLFNNLDKVLCLGMTIKMIGGILKVNVEPRSNFFQIGTTMFHIGTIKEKTFGRDIKKDLFFNEIKVGGETGEYLEVGSLKEYNIKAEFSSCLKTMKGVYDLVTDWCRDGYGIEYARRLVYAESNTTDSKYDEFIWLFDCVEDVNGNLIQRTTEGFTSVLGIPLITTPINLDFTPKRSLIRHGWWINSGLSKYPGEVLKYNKSKITNPLSTLKTGETIPVVENGDISNSELGTPLLTGHVVKLAHSPTQAEWDIIDADPTGIISYINQNTKELNYGFNWDFSQDPVRNEPTNIVLLEAFPPTVATVNYEVTESGDYIVTESGDRILIV